MLRNTDIVVIGSGPGGSITANILSENGFEVVLVENGPKFPVDSCAPFSIEEMEQKYKNGGITPTFGNPKITYVEGNCVGGGSEINSGLYHRIPSDILEKWKEIYSINNLDEDALENHYTVIEKTLSITYSRKNDFLKASKKLVEGARKLGWKCIEVPRWYRYTDSNSSVKQSMTKTLIPEFEKNGGFLYANTVVLQIVQERKKWRIICKDLNTKRKTSVLCNYVFVCGGAIQTPFLLRKSGIKNNIGNTLQIHPTIKILAEFPEKINSVKMGVGVHQVKEFAPDYSFGCSVSTKPYLALTMLDYPQFMEEIDNHWEYMANFYAMIVPRGTGTIRKFPIFKDPFVSYKLEDWDMRLLSKALKNLCKLLFHAGAKQLFPGINGFEPLTKLDDINTIPPVLPRDKTNLMTIHLFSSCPMGENSRICATDSFGRVHGYRNLYINDGSILPSAPGVNPQGAIMAIARRNVFAFLSDYYD